MRLYTGFEKERAEIGKQKTKVLRAYLGKSISAKNAKAEMDRLCNNERQLIFVSKSMGLYKVIKSTKPTKKA